jgi:hypothetical protein
VLLREDPRPGVPRDDQDRPGGTTQNAFGHRSLSEPAPSTAPVGTKNDDIDFPGVGVKHNHAGRIAVLLFDTHRDTCRLGASPKVGEVLEPLGGARRESNVRRGRVEQKELGAANHREIERTLEGAFARLLEIIAHRMRPNVGIRRA